MDSEQKNLLKTVLKMFTKYGIKSVSMDDIARELGISKKTLYTFVKDKNELVEKAIDFQCKERLQLMKSLNLESLPALQEVIEVSKIIDKTIGEFNPAFQYDLAKYFSPIYKKMMQINREAMSQSMLQNFKKGKQEGFYRPEIKEDLLVKMHISNVENLAEIQFYNSAEWTPDEIQQELFSYHMHAILTPLGLEEYKRLLTNKEK